MTKDEWKTLLHLYTQLKDNTQIYFDMSFYVLVCELHIILC